ncbi:MAG: hypothetical protein KDK36_10375 [Leptospiraceae bacterium]|nr:hypothetical protein [Leptospiraceae bacterium]
MRSEVSQRLLHSVLDLDDSELTDVWKTVEAISDYKYDSYQQFAPGLRFTESLCLWLEQFNLIKERLVAYNFIKNNLIFVSSDEMKHLIRMAYPDCIKSYLIDKVSEETNIPNYHIKKILNHDSFKFLKARSLFLGLSDGSHIDDFRRFSQIRHEQVYSTYLISTEKSKDFIKKLKKYLKDTFANTDDAKFETAFLLDDFSGSGYSFLHKEDGDYDGKIVRFYKSIISNQELKDLFDLEKLKICVVLYMATSKARDKIEKLGKDYFKPKSVDFSIKVIHELKENILINNSDHTDLFPILQKYYTKKIESESYKKGNMDNPFLGFDGCALPLVLYHNCPNNSIPILWMDPEHYSPRRGIFPRTERFLKE